MAETRQLLCERFGKQIMLTVPADAHITFGPWSPPAENGEKSYSPEAKRGTLRIYAADKKLILAVFAGVTSFRDVTAVSYAEQVERIESSTVWKDNEKGYFHQTTGTREKAWVVGEALPPGGTD